MYCLPNAEVETSDPNGPFLKTEFNRDGDSYRSPLSNKYFPESEGYLPQGELRRIEEIGNVLFAEYTKLYYGNGAISNFFVTEGSNADTFSFGFFAKKGSSASMQSAMKAMSLDLRATGTHLMLQMLPYLETKPRSN
jgi:hypothetical protein